MLEPHQHVDHVQDNLKATKDLQIRRCPWAMDLLAKQGLRVASNQVPEHLLPVATKARPLSMYVKQCSEQAMTLRAVALSSTGLHDCNPCASGNVEFIVRLVAG